MKPLERTFIKAALSILLPFLLSLLPLFILIKEEKGAKSLQLEDARKNWLEKTQPISKRVQEMASPYFWPEETSRRIKKRMERQSPAVLGDSRQFAKALVKSAGATGLQGVDPGRIWAIHFPNQDLDAAGILLQENGLDSSARFIFSGLLREITRECAHLPANPDQKTISTRLKSFGDGISKELLSQNFQGKGFYVIFQGKYGMAIWDVVKFNNKPIGAYFIVFPIDQDFVKKSISATLKNYENLFRNPHAWPVFLPLTFGKTRGRVTPSIHPKISRTSAMRFIKGMYRNFSIRVSPSAGRIGRVNLLMDRLNKVSEGEGWKGLVFPLQPVMGNLGFLVSKTPPLPINFIEILGKSYSIFFAVFWTFFFSFLAFGGKFPSPGVKVELTLWFLGIAATPIAFILGSGERLNIDLQSNMKESLKQSLHQSLSEIDSNSVRLTTEFLRVCRTISGKMRIGELMEESRKKPEVHKDIMAKIRNSCEKTGITPASILIFGHDDNDYTWFPASVNPEKASSSIWFQKALALEILHRESPRLFSKPKEGGGKTSSALKLAQSGIFNENPDLSSKPDEITVFQSGLKQSMHYYNILKIGGEARYVFYLTWDQEDLYSHYLKAAIKKAKAENPRFFFYVAKVTPDGLELISRAGEKTELNLLYKHGKTGAMTAETNQCILTSFVSSKMPGVLLAAGTSLSPMLKTLHQEKIGMVKNLAGILLLILIGAGTISGWLAMPIVRMTKGLELVAARNLEVRVSEFREDEIGQTGKTLDTMTQWLKEREMMSRFVSPQVLDAVADGDFSQACQAQSREVALLVTDVRNFTTMSESYTPREIFALINSHLQRMTVVIQKYRGAIDRFIGDAIQAVFYPGPGESMVIRALHAAREMMIEHHKLREERKQKGEFDYNIGVGVEIGEVVTGVLGDREVRLDFTVLGEPFKHASDLESYSKKGKALKIICSPRIRELAGKDFAFIPLEDPENPGNFEMADSGCGEISQPISDSKVATKPSNDEALTIRNPTPQPVKVPTNQLSPDKFQQKEPQVSDRSESGTSTPETRFSSLQTFFFCFIWTIPLMLAFSSFIKLQEGEIRINQQNAKNLLQEDWKIIEQTMDPKIQASTYVMNQLRDLDGNFENPTDFHARYQKALSQPLSTIQEAFPGTSWVLFDHSHRMEGYFFATRESSKIVASGGKPCPMNASFLTDLFTVLKLEFFSFSTAHLSKTFREEVAVKLGLAEHKTIITTRGRIVPIKFEGKSMALFWLPITDRDFKVPPQMFSRKILSSDTVNNFSPHLLGGLLVFMDLNEILGKGIECMVKNMAIEGCAMAFFSETETVPKEWIHPIFRGKFPSKDLVWDEFIFNLKKSLPEWEILSGEIAKDQTYRIITARKFKSAEGEFPELKFFCVFFGLLWVLGGIWIVRSFGIMSRPVSLSTKWQLAGAFLIALLPSLVLGILSLERSFREQKTRLQSDHELKLIGAMNSVDEGRNLYLGYLVGLSERTLQNDEFLKATMKIENDRNKVAGSEFLKDLYFSFSKMGVSLDFPMIIGPGNLLLEFNAVETLNQIIIETYRNQNVPSLLALNPALGKKVGKLSSREMGFGFIAEEGKNVLGSSISPDKSAEMFHAPKIVFQLSSAGKENCMIRQHLFDKGKPHYTLLSRVKMDAIDFQMMNGWRRRGFFGESNVPYVHFLETELPHSFLFPPYWRTSLGDEKDPAINFDTLSGPLPPEIVKLSQLANFSGLRLSKVIGKGSDAISYIAGKGNQMKDRIFLSSIPIGKLIAEKESEIRTRRILLAALFLFTLLLSFWAANQFLTPIFELRDAAKEIMKDNFKVRLPECMGGEFGNLAKAFNQMALEVSQGRLLSKFVSESVRNAAKDQTRSEAALKGETVDVTVIFAGLADFKSLLVHMPPEELVVILNRFLESMSQCIRAHKGDIDKFIGDKILAVFHPSTLGSVENAALAAVKAADAMRERMKSLSDILNKPLGVGVVSGSVLAGIMGTSVVRLEYTVIGDTVNLASRLGDLSQKTDLEGNVLKDPTKGQGGVVIEANTADLIQKVGKIELLSRLKKMQVPPIKGKTRSVEAYFLKG